MVYFVYAVVILAAVRCISFGVYSIRHSNLGGGIAAMVLACLSLVAGSAVFY